MIHSFGVLCLFFFVLDAIEKQDRITQARIDELQWRLDRDRDQDRDQNQTYFSEDT